MNSAIYKFLFLLTFANGSLFASTPNPNTQKIDYLSKIPKEMIKEILENVTDPVECIQTIKRLRSVGKNWNTFLGKDPIQKMQEMHEITIYLERVRKKYSDSKEFIKEIIALRKKNETFKKIVTRNKAMQYKIAGEFMVAYDYPLHEAAKIGFTEITDPLIQHFKNDVNRANNWDGTTPLYWAAAKGHTKIVKMLLYHNADANKADNDGQTPLDCSSVNGHTETVKMLLDYKADVNKAGWLGFTPLHWAAIFGPTDIVELLLKAGANRGIKNKKGQTPLDIAIIRRHTDIVELLKKSETK